MYRVEVFNKGDDVFRVRAREREFLIEAPAEGMSPVEVFLGSLAGCMGLFARRYLEKTDLRHARFSITVESDLPAGTPMSFKEIAVSINLEGALLTTVQRQELVDAVKSCPVYGTLKSNPAISVRLV